jgi:hypothetical protein
MGAMPFPVGRSGRLTTLDGAPVPAAEVTVDSWSVEPVGRRRIAREHTTVTKTDAEGRWAVATRPVVRFGIALPDALPVSEDEFTFRGDGQTDLRVPFPRIWHEADETDRSTMRVDASGPPPFGGVTLLVVGGAIGSGQKLSAHGGGMFVLSRDGFGAGARAAVDVGLNGAGADAGIVLIPFRGSTPNLGIEFNARYLRPWREGAGASAESGPEIGFDLLGYRLTLSWLAPAIGVPAGQRRLVVGFGFGYF